MSRKKFLAQTGILSAGFFFNPLTGKTQPAGKKIKVAVIGCGSVSGVYLPHLTKAQYVEVVSVCDIKPDRAANRAKEFNVPNQYPHIDQLLAGAPFDLLINLTNMQEHEHLNREALNAGKHVWSEKPMANSYKAGRALLDLAKTKGLRMWGAPAVVNSPQFAFMAKAINEGKLGTLAAAHANYGHTGPTWSAFFYEKGGGSLPDLGVYNLATLSGLLGPVKSVVAMTSIVTKTRTVDDKGTIPVEAEDNAMVIMDHGNGVLSHVQCGFNYFDPYGHEGKGQSRPTITIWGSKGNMALIGYDWAPFGVELATSDAEEPQKFVTDPGTYVWQQGASVICEALATGTEPRINAEHALHVLEIIQAARQSQETGRRINLESTFPWPVVK
ncbi:Gfo/Idh/MocA family oxidoreductase [Panacibacter sp. DH6]|uniref:Gfo/Idh/MocA family oxidoreductase n=1 Tax=Panacibacter microcysteis TaxID=2793269 RepID=A0A931GZS4_9BACT|nr:Gfo/Idh/MocA family oxidoreductase [Panacibacter microcysteis]MBG9378377.1 Gfo/Idh/MocA family oxidoreductase [Panacibacter microcysteis]